MESNSTCISLSESARRTIYKVVSEVCIPLTNHISVTTRTIYKVVSEVCIPLTNHISVITRCYSYSNTLKMKLTLMDRFNYLNDDKQKLAIPIGPRFQADVPEWKGPLCKNKGSLNESNSSKWLGTAIWTTKDMTPDNERCVIGKGRPEFCSCSTPGSLLCVNRHISEETTHLQTILGSAFQKWKFDHMGEAVAKLWKQPDQERLTYLIKNNPEGQDFIKTALKCFPLNSKKDILDFYFNVYIPRQMSIQTRSGYVLVNTDDDGDDAQCPYKKSRKKARVDCVTMYRPKLVKSRYLNGRR